MLAKVQLSPYPSDTNLHKFLRVPAHMLQACKFTRVAASSQRAFPTKFVNPRLSKYFNQGLAKFKTTLSQKIKPDLQTW
jgi:hypothetical protein